MNKIDTAVSLVVDCSGSMSRDKIGLAAVATYAMAQVLERINVPCEVLGFTTVSIDSEANAEMKESIRELGRTYSRYEGIYLPIFKSFNERLGLEQRRRIAYMPHKSFLRNNIDGESVEYAAMRLLGRREPGKVMFVLSDGQPAAYGDSRALCRHLESTVKKVEKSGVRVMGIGILDDSVKHYYPKFAVLNNLEELPNRIMTELRAALV